MSAASVFETASSQDQQRDLGRFKPLVPEHANDLGISPNTVINLMLKMTMLEGETALSKVADRLKIHQVVADEIFQHLRREQFVEVKGMVGNDYVMTLTQTGRQVAQDRYRVSQYVGPAPVPFDEYNRAVRSQTSRHHVNRDKLKDVFSDLCLSDQVLDEIGPAVMSNAQIFLYGSTGNGKTSIAERLVRIFKDDVYIPYAVEVDGQIINVHDSVVHRELDPEPETDPRWIRCSRPCIAVGGEMVQGMLELQYEESLGFYNAPLQMKANNGLFIIDDFGRQLVDPKDLLNRWIVPLDRGVDFLTLRTGVKVPVPFETLVVFSTNLDPQDLADEAFLRRIQNKIKIDAVSNEIFDNILARVCEDHFVTWTPEQSRFAREACLSEGGSKVLRACYPRDIVLILKNIANYEERPAELSRDDIRRAVKLYFAN